MPLSNEITVYVDNLPKGAIILWFGSLTDVPDNWQICNGTKGTPNLIDQFIVGAGGQYSLNNTGGQAKVTLTNAEMPAHNHSNGTFQVLDNNAVVGAFPKVNGHADWSWENLVIPSDGTKLSIRRLPSDGSNQPHENRPPFTAIYYIMKIV